MLCVCFHSLCCNWVGTRLCKNYPSETQFCFLYAVFVLAYMTHFIFLFYFSYFIFCFVYFFSIVVFLRIWVEHFKTLSHVCIFFRLIHADCTDPDLCAFFYFFFLFHLCHKTREFAFFFKCDYVLFKVQNTVNPQERASSGIYLWDCFFKYLDVCLGGIVENCVFECVLAIVFVCQGGQILCTL